MKLNREKIAAALSFFIMAYGIYNLVASPGLVKPPRINVQPPPSSHQTPRIEPRLFVEEGTGGRNPFQVVSEWVPATPEILPPPVVKPSRFFQLPPGLGPDPAEVGFVFLASPPAEKDDDGDVDGEGDGTGDGTSDGGTGAGSGGNP